MNVLLVIQEYENQHLMLPQILEELTKIGKESGKVYRSGLVHDWRPKWRHRLWALGQPTVVISMEQLWRFRPKWATILANRNMDKIQEYLALERAGIPIPRWAAVKKGEVPDLRGFDAFVVVKPARGGCGALVRIMRRDRVRWRPLEVKKFKWANMDLIAQEYIHTGPWPTSYRVGTVFGEPIYAWRIVADRSRRPFEGQRRDSHFFDGRTIVASGKGCVFDWKVPDDIFDLARRTHERVFPNIPLLGTDIIRDDRTGKLYVLEVNAMGDTFHLTSRVAERIKHEFDLDSIKQFGGASAVARGIYKRLNEFASNGSKHPVGSFQPEEKEPVMQ